MYQSAESFHVTSSGILQEMHVVLANPEVLHASESWGGKPRDTRITIVKTSDAEGRFVVEP